MGYKSLYFREEEFKDKSGRESPYPHTVQDDLYDLCDRIRMLYGRPLVVSSGYRSPEHNKEVGGVSESFHCLDTETEILTLNGWKSVNTITYADKAITMDIATGSLEVTAIDCINKRPSMDRMVYISTTYINCLVTNKHNLVYKVDKYADRKNKLKTKPKDFSNSKYHQSLTKLPYELVSAEKVVGIRKEIPITGILPLKKSKYNLDFLKLITAIVSDGFIQQEGNSWDIGFNFKKQRKIQEIERLLKSLNYDYSKTHVVSREKQGQFGIYHINILGGNKVKLPIINIVTPKKELPWFFLGLSPEEKLELIKEYAFFDGHTDTRKASYTGMSISGIKEQTIDILQAMCVTSGLRCIKNIKTAEELNKESARTVTAKHTCYTLQISKGKQYTRMLKEDSSMVPYKGYVWCISNKNNTIITRREGKVVIMGNCKGMAADLQPLQKDKEFVDVLHFYAKAVNMQGGIGLYDWGVHVDIRGTKAMWDYRTKKEE